MSQLVLLFCFMNYLHYVYTNLRATGGSAEQPLLGRSEKALNQPKPHPSDRTVWGCYVISSDRLMGFALRRLPTGRPSKGPRIIGFNLM